MIFIDSHAHVNDPAFDQDRPEVIQKSFDAGLSHIIEIACEPQEWKPAIELCAQYSGKIYAAGGVHPIYAKEALNPANIKELKDFLARPEVRAIGEIGLDYAYEEESPRDIQNQAFEAMLDIAAEVKKPIVLHCRKNNEPGDFSAYDDMFRALKTASYNGGIMHCFSGRYSDAVQALDGGLLIGINGIIGYKKNEELRETIKKIGIKYLVMETDCPYLPPQSKRGKRNDPSNIPEITATLADILGIPLSKAADITTENSMAIFKL